MKKDKPQFYGEILKIIESGFAGVTTKGKIVDRRKFPNAIPIPENKSMNVPKPKVVVDKKGRINLDARLPLTEAWQNVNTKPPIVCLCGSTRFMQEFFDYGWIYTLRGYIVLSIGVCKHAEGHGGEALGQDVADMLDKLHLHKIDLADEVFIINKDGHIGESTRKEIDYAMKHSKLMVYLEKNKQGAK